MTSEPPLIAHTPGQQVLLDFAKQYGVERFIAQKIYHWQRLTKYRLLLHNQKTLIQRQTAGEKHELDKARKVFLDELFDQLEKLRRLMQIFKDLSDNIGHLWNLAQTELKDTGFDVLEHYADLLDNDQGLTELLDMIGRYQQHERAYHKEQRNKKTIPHDDEMQPAYKGQISGLQLSDCIENTLPSELGLYSNPHTKSIFCLRFAQKQLLTYAYMRQTAQRPYIEPEEVHVNESQGKGPMIICVDTSGSMRGTPERTAKTITYAIAKKALIEQRNCYLISFSTNIHVMDLSLLDSANGLQQLVAFLRLSFHGGTDANPALSHALDMLDKEKWKQADVLMISDFIMDKLRPSVEERIKQHRSKKTRFYSLAITSEFTNSPDATHQLVRLVDRI